jgi:hypothetical protein
VRIISLLDPLITHPEPHSSKASEPPPNLSDDLLPSTLGLEELEERVRSIYDSGVDVDLIVEAVNAGLGASGRRLVRRQSARMKRHAASKLPSRLLVTPR